jgi:hypothetical protein
LDATGTQYIGELADFTELIMYLLESEINLQILISGAFDNVIYKDILDMVLRFRKAKNCRLIIPYVTSSGVISRPYINKISENGGQIRINSQFKKNLLVIGRYVFLISFSNKYNSSYGVKTKFEYSIITDQVSVVNAIQNDFMDMWNESLPLMTNGA